MSKSKLLKNCTKNNNKLGLFKQFHYVADLFSTKLILCCKLTNHLTQI